MNAPDPIPNHSGEEVPRTEGNGCDDADSQGEDWTLARLQAAFSNPDHPDHDEAVEKNAALAAAVSPALDRLRKAVDDQVEGIRPIIKSLSPIRSDHAERDFGGLEPINHMSETALVSQRNLQAIEEALSERQRESEDEARQLGARLAREEAVANASLGVLQSMDAKLRSVDGRLDAVETRLREGNNSAGQSARWMLRVGWATLGVALLSLFATLAIYFVT